jgi:hypothetical protein
MTLLGNRALADNVILTGIDAALLTNYRLRDGATYQDVVNMADAALGGFNAGLGNDPFLVGFDLFYRPDGKPLCYRQ